MQKKNLLLCYCLFHQLTIGESDLFFWYKTVFFHCICDQENITLRSSTQLT